MLTLTKAVTVGQFCALKLPQSGSILRAQYHSTPFGFTEVGRRQKVKGKRQKQEVGAQRLSASQRWAEGKRQKVKGKSGKWVLNAFRHHRGRQKAKGIRQKAKAGSGYSTPFGFTEVGLRQKAKVGSGCSTPFGITEVGRRQKAKVGSGCSTPCGFTQGGIFCLLPFVF